MRWRSKPKVEDFEDIGHSRPRRAAVFRVIKTLRGWMSVPFRQAPWTPREKEIARFPGYSLYL